MSLVGKVGRKRPRARLAMALLYGVLCLGAVTTLYPFILMISTGLKGPVDQNDNRVVPVFLNDDTELLKKYVDDKYAGDRSAIQSSRIGADAASEKEYEAFLAKLPTQYWRAGFQLAPNQVTSRLRVNYQAWLHTKYPSIDAVNKAYTEEAVGYQTIDVPAEMLDRKSWTPPRTRKYNEWLEYKATLPVEYRVPMRLDEMYQRYLAAQYKNRFELVPADLKGTAKAFEDLRPTRKGPIWEAFLRDSLPARYRDGAAEAIWKQQGHAGDLPVVAFENAFVAGHAHDIRTEFAGRNYLYILDYILLNGSAVWNTVVFCGLAILTQLIVNPLAAYALSRYPIRWSGQILIFLLATMAFPSEVAMIPSFLLLKNLGLLNTFAALVLPSAASGYMIFLLKGFFDSLPQELFEAAQLDGAREHVMMTRVAFPLSKPVLGYIALMAFMGAYGAFMYAFLIAQDQRMWTLTVWIYQLQQVAPKAVMMAALTLAALPTLIVFLCAQNVIMRGIVLPGER